MLTLLLVFIWLLAFFSAGHALLTKRDPRAALGWIVACIALPGFGALFYWMFGVNRIRTRARELQEQGQGMHWLNVDASPSSRDLRRFPDTPTSHALIQLSDAVTRRPLICGNSVKVLYNGEQAYPAMLEAIRNAKEMVLLCSYIFKADCTGELFVKELAAATKRGVDVRVLIDAFGQYYALAKVRHLLKREKIPFAIFMPPSLARSLYLNMRNHRKLLVVDNDISFTGGMNICDKHLAEIKNNPRRAIDLHFRLEGPISNQLRDAFLEDWHFATDEKRKPRNWPIPQVSGNACCRGISAGPNEQHEKLNWILIGALTCATSYIRIMTPYFIPTRAQLAAISAAALRGVKVDILLPEQNNLPYMSWATNAFLFELLEHNVNIYYQPPPFVHSKLLLIDDEYALVGSANLDPRSLRLNFEFNVEIFDTETITELGDHFDQSRARSRQVSLAEIDQRSLPLRLRDSFCKLFTPYL
ncbi:cardiolipin synthase [Malonomonas rubra]|uniref:cardiolipin synthase n=1 Tax=Malonomonas rubra TaxID=57040 RepID=UPI0026F28D43|nr:cardiolipin synthase [Malonomonas rubra]